jgi:hypothetical protein
LVLKNIYIYIYSIVTKNKFDTINLFSINKQKNKYNFFENHIQNIYYYDSSDTKSPKRLDNYN